MNDQRIILAGGCFWGVQELLRKVPGVISTEVGYCGGDFQHPTYEDLKTGKTGHAESVLVIFDHNVISLFDLLTEHFFKIHDPTTPNRQGNDVGSQYRSAIFYSDITHKAIIEQAIKAIDQSKFWPKKVITEILPEKTFWPAEKYHQDYLQNYPNGYTCHYYR